MPIMATEENNNKTSKFHSNLTPSPQKNNPICPNQDALALSFPRNEEPVPLEVFYPSDEKNKSNPLKRRSSRFTTNMFSTSACATTEKMYKEVEDKGKSVNSRKSEGIKRAELSRKRKYKNEDELTEARLEILALKDSASSTRDAGTGKGTKRELMALLTPESKSRSAVEKRATRGCDSVNAGHNSLELVSPESAPATRSGGNKSATKRELLALLTPERKNSCPLKRCSSRGSDSVNVGHNSLELALPKSASGAGAGSKKEMGETRKSPRSEPDSNGARLELLASPESASGTRAASKKYGTKRELLALLTPNSSALKARASRGRKDAVFTESPETSEMKTLRSRKIQVSVKNNDNNKGSEMKRKKSLSSAGKNGSVNSSSDTAEKSVRKQNYNVCFIGEPILEEEAQEKWQWRYNLKNQKKQRQGWKLNAGEEDEIVLNVECHYAQAKVAGFIFNIGDCAYVKHGLDRKDVPPAHFYCDMEYCVDYSTFRTLHNVKSSVSSSLVNDASYKPVTTYPLEVLPTCEPMKVELSLLDLYAGCGGMSMGLCLGTKLSGLDLVTKWAVDFNRSACGSLKLNHPQTHVRNEGVEDFLELLKRWEKLIQSYGCSDFKTSSNCELHDRDEGENNDDAQAGSKASSGEYEVLRLVDICYGDPNNKGKSGLHFKVRWKGYSQSDDTWEPIENLENCGDSIKDFVRRGQQLKILPLPGDVDMICGGPPCQGISGYNRHRNVDDPLSDEKNRQIIIFMDVVEFLRPKYVLMENVSDILRFDKASLGRYALSRLVHMKYQARLGTMAAGCYGLPQFRLRVFFWGALPSERLPPFPLPSHDVIVKYWPSPEFERNTVAYEEGQPRDLEEALVLRDAISDMPAVTWHESREEMPYDMPSQTEFQKYIRLSKHEIMSCSSTGVMETKEPVLSDHRPCQLNEDDYLRVCLVPHRKGANFRDLPGVIVGADNVAHRDTNDPKVLPNGKPMVPDCAFNFEHGKSKRPFARLWWDETVATLVTFPNHRAQAILHPEQDRVLTIREYARLQGFPDFYRFTGTLKERYCQVGNAVAVPVGRALGYALGLAYQRLAGNEPLIKLPPNFSFLTPPIDDIVVLQK